MATWKNVLAVIFDCDDTLTDDTTSALLAASDKDPKEFWGEGKQVDRLVREEGWEPTNAWLHVLLKYAAKDQLKYQTNAKLRAFGKTLRPYPGLQNLFKDLKKITVGSSCEIEFYIISGGIEDIVRGFASREEFKDVFRAVWGSRVAPETSGGPIRYIARAITFTEKTRYIYAINKLADISEFEKNPARVNDYVPERNRRIPFANMIYVGDGLSDIPCFSIIEPSARRGAEAAEGKEPVGGMVFPVFRPNSAKWQWENLLFPQRIPRGPFDPLYGRKRALGANLRYAVRTVWSNVILRTGSKSTQ
jgi:phosphoglycolate phosphatase-like HAD superfamily hydrolase